MYGVSLCALNKSCIFLKAVREAIAARQNLLLALGQLSAHVAFFLLSISFVVPKVTYLLRTTPAWQYPVSVSVSDGMLREATESILNVSRDLHQWIHANKERCIGLRRILNLALPVFLASAHKVASLVTVTLSTNSDGDYNQHGTVISGGSACPGV